MSWTLSASISANPIVMGVRVDAATEWNRATPTPGVVEPLGFCRNIHGATFSDQ